MAEQKQGNQLKPTYNSSVWIWDVALRTSQKQWTIGRDGEGGAGVSVLMAWQDDGDDDDDINSKSKLFTIYRESLKLVVIEEIII